jgi:hypothetical protein
MRKRSKHPHWLPSQHIPKASDEPSDGPSDSNPSSHTPFLTNTTTVAHDTSTDDERSLQAVENDAFEVICRSMIGPAPTAHASAPDVRTSVVYEPSPTKGAFLSSASAGHGMSTGIGVGPHPAVQNANTGCRWPSLGLVLILSLSLILSHLATTTRRRSHPPCTTRMTRTYI